jgi:hypothetical protein
LARELMQGITVPSITVPNLSETGSNLIGTILTGGLVAAIVSFFGVLITQHFTGKRHSKDLLQARELEPQRAHEAALQKYFEQMGRLLADPDRPLLRSTPGDNLSTLAQAQTLSILEGLDDPVRKRILLQFLYKTGLIRKDKPVISLVGAILSEASLSGADLNKADLSGADLSGADLSGADLSGIDLSGADVSRGLPERCRPERRRRERCRPEQCRPERCRPK